MPTSSASVNIRTVDGSNVPDVLPRPSISFLYKYNWTDDWRLAAPPEPGKDPNTTGGKLGFVYPLRSALTIAPNVSEAEFQYESGRITREGSAKDVDFEPLFYSELPPFVRIDVTAFHRKDNGDADPYTVTTFVGVPVALGTTMGGSKDAIYATQTFKAAGIEHLLDRRVIDSSFVAKGTNTAEIDRCLIFNEQYERGFSEVGNRSAFQVSADEEPFPVYPFEDPASGYTVPWTAKDILGYMLHFYPNPQGVQFYLSSNSASVALDAIIPPKLHVAGMTIRQVLDRLISMRTGIGWRAGVDAGGDAFVEIFSLFETNVDLGNGVTLDANPNQVKLAAGDFAHVHDVRVTVDELEQYGTIRVSGEPILSCFSLSFTDVTLTEGWTSTEEAAYKTAASSGTVPEKNDAIRATDKFHHVYSTYAVPSDFNWMVGNGEGTFVSNGNANPRVSDDGTLDFTQQPPIRPWGRTFEHHLPLREDVEKDVHGSPVKLTPEFRKPFALVFDDKRANHYVYAHNLPYGDVGCAEVRPHDTHLALQVHFNPQHLLGKGHFDAGPAAAISNYRPEFDYAKMILTVAARTDQRPHVVITIPGADARRILNLVVRDAELWHVAPGTVLEVLPDGTLNRQADDPSKILRDDTKDLTAYARLAKVWYGRRRSTAAFTTAFLRDPLDFPPGCLLMGIDNSGLFQNVITVVSRVTWDYRDFRTAVETTYADLAIGGGYFPLR